jgi:hypothetical protein
MTSIGPPDEDQKNTSKAKARQTQRDIQQTCETVHNDNFAPSIEGDEKGAQHGDSAVENRALTRKRSDSSISDRLSHREMFGNSRVQPETDQGRGLVQDGQYRVVAKVKGVWETMEDTLQRYMFV